MTERPNLVCDWKEHPALICRKPSSFFYVSEGVVMGTGLSILQNRCEEHKIDTDSMSVYIEISYDEALVRSVMSK